MGDSGTKPQNFRFQDAIIAQLQEKNALLFCFEGVINSHSRR